MRGAHLTAWIVGKRCSRFFAKCLKSSRESAAGRLKQRSSCSRKISCSASPVFILSTVSWERRRNSNRASSRSHVPTRTKMATNKPKNKSVGNATDRARLRHRLRGSPQITNIRGRTTKTPRVSPIHHQAQFAIRSARGTTPSAQRPANDNVGLVTQKAGDRNKKRHKSR